MRSMAVRTNHIASVTDKLPSSKSSTTRRLRRSIASMTDRLPSSKELDQFGTNGMLALIHDAIGHLITPVSSLPKVMPVLQQVAEALLKQQAFLEEVLAVRRDAVLDDFAAGNVEGMFSLSHSVIGRDLRFVSASEPYCHLFEFSQSQLRSMSLDDLLRPADIPRFSKIVKPLLAGRVESCELVDWRATGSRRFVLTKDTFWAIGRRAARGPQFILTSSEKIAGQDEAPMLIQNGKLRVRGRAAQHGPE